MKLGAVVDIYSVSTCISKDFTYYIPHWRHNGYWLFNKPGDMDEILSKENLKRDSFKLFYYEVYDYQFDEREMRWLPFSPESVSSFVTNIDNSAMKSLEGFDVASYESGSNPGHSPLSCNGLAGELPVNAHCLFVSIEAAKDSLEAGRFANTEPGPFRILSVYSVSI